MAGAILGEMPIEIGGKRYRFVLGTYGLKMLEQSLGKPWPKVMQEATSDGWGFAVALALFHAGLIFHHESLTERQASLLLDELGMDRFGEIFAQAIKAQFPDPPQPAAITTNGTGIDSMSSG